MSAPVTYNHHEFTLVPPRRVVIHLFDHGHPRVCSGFDLLSLMTNDVQCSSMVSVATVYPLSDKSILKSFVHV